MLVGSGWQERYTFISLRSNGRRNSHHSVQNIKADTGYSSSSSCEGDCRHSRSLSSEAFLDSSSSCNRSLQTPLLQPRRECELLGSCGAVAMLLLRVAVARATLTKVTHGLWRASFHCWLGLFLFLPSQPWSGGSFLYLDVFG